MSTKRYFLNDKSVYKADRLYFKADEYGEEYLYILELYCNSNKFTFTLVLGNNVIRFEGEFEVDRDKLTLNYKNRLFEFNKESYNKTVVVYYILEDHLHNNLNKTSHLILNISTYVFPQDDLKEIIRNLMPKDLSALFFRNIPLDTINRKLYANIH